MAQGHGWTDPFIAMTADGWDTKVDIQSGKVEEIKPGKNDNGMFSIAIRAENTPYGISGWLNSKRDPVIFKIIKEAQERDVNIMVRVERQRLKKEDQTPDISITEIADKNATSRLNRKITGVYIPNKKEWLLTSDTYSNPEEDPQETKQFIDYIQRTWEEATQGPALSNEEIVAVFEGEQAESEPSVPVIKGRPFDIMQNKITMYFFVQDALQKSEYSMDDESIKKVSLALCNLADKIQKKMVGAINPGDYSHTRARYLIFRIIETFHPINDESMQDIKKWILSIYNIAKQMIEWSRTE